MELSTQRLLLREFRADDFTAFHAYYGDPEFQRYEGKDISPEALRARMEHNLADIAQQPRVIYRLAVTVPPDDTAIGHVSLMLLNESAQEWEIGWGIHRGHWGKGYASEGARVMMQYAFETLKVHRLVAFCHAGNLASARVMEKLGMQREGHLRQSRWMNNNWYDEFVYAILSHEYQPG